MLCVLETYGRNIRTQSGAFLWFHYTVGNGAKYTTINGYVNMECIMEGQDRKEVFRASLATMHA